MCDKNNRLSIYWLKYSQLLTFATALCATDRPGSVEEEGRQKEYLCMYDIL